MLNDRSSARSRSALLALSAMALMGTGASVVSTSPATQATATAGAPGQPGNPMLAGQQAPMAPDDRRQWLRSRRSRGARALRQSAGTHKQNRRRALAGR